MTAPSRSSAQQRADDIRVFQQELARLKVEGALTLSDTQALGLKAHHDSVLAGLAQSFDIDRDMRGKQLSWGMRIASFLGALALAASVFFLFYQFWGEFSEPVQVAILICASLAGFALTIWLQGRDGTGYFTKLAALVAFACFVLNIKILGQIFNITPSDKALLAWAAYALLLAYTCDLRLLLVAGLLCIDAYMAARFGAWSGTYWIHFGERPENFIPLSFVLFFLPQFVPHSRREDFPAVYRLVGLISLLLPILILSNWGDGSYLPLSDGTIESLYQTMGFVLSAGAIWLGLAKQWTETINGGIAFFVISLYTKFFDWWWELMPKYLFFLLIGLTAILFLVLIKRLRAASTERQPL